MEGKVFFVCEGVNKIKSSVWKEVLFFKNPFLLDFIMWQSRK